MHFVRTPIPAASIGGLLLLVFLLILFICGAQPAHAQPGDSSPSLTIAATDTPLRITGVLDGENVAFSRNVLLTVYGGNATELQFLASDLIDVADPTRIIDRSNVSLPAGVTLTAGRSTDVRITLNNVTQPGLYTGTVILRAQIAVQPDGVGTSDVTVTREITVPVTAQIDARPVVTPFPAERSLHRVRCNWPPDCFLAAQLLGESAVSDVWHVDLVNSTQQPVTVLSQRASLLAGRTAESVTEAQVTVEKVGMIPANDTKMVTITVARNELAADSYRGELRFGVQGLKEPVVLKTTIDIRHGPLLALLTIIAGYAVGWLARQREKPLAKKQINLTPFWSQLLNRAEQITDPGLRAKVKDAFDASWQQLLSPNVDEETARAALNLLEEQIQILLHMQEIEQALLGKTDPVAKELVDLIKVERTEFLAGSWETVKTQHQTLVAKYYQWRRDSTKMDDPPKMALTTNARKRDTSPATKRGSHTLWASFIAMIQTNVPRIWLIISRLLAVITVVLLVFLGMKTLYIDATIFGSAGFFDYVALFVWGLSVDVAGSTLYNLPSLTK